MKAKEIIEEYIKEEKREDVAVMAVPSKGFWWHVHLDEEIPTEGEHIAIIIRDEILRKGKP